METVLKAITTVKEALHQVTEGPNRTTRFGVINNTPFAIDIAFGQIKSTVTGNGWIADTGVFTFASRDGGCPTCLIR